jgi:hypothetical protein
MIRRKYPFEYEPSPQTIEKGTRWLTLRLKNIRDDSLHDMDINMHSTDSLQISLRKSSNHIFRLRPDEESIRLNSNDLMWLGILSRKMYD